MSKLKVGWIWAPGSGATAETSLCLANLDEHALCAAAEALRAADIPTGLLTINDSLTISRRHSSPLLTHEVLQLAQQAATSCLGYAVTFKYPPQLRTSGETAPTLHSVVIASGLLLSHLSDLPNPPLCAEYGSPGTGGASTHPRLPPVRRKWPTY